jgi:uncharacterized protein (TIGR03083 family)
MTLDRVTVLAGLADELREFVRLLGELDPSELDTATACDGWTVRDVAGHVVGTAVDITQGRLEGQGSPEVTGRQARERAGATPDQLAAELDNAIPDLTALLEMLPAESWDGPSPDGRYTLGFAVEAMWYDAYVHGHDIRTATGRPADRGPGLRCAVHHLAGYLDGRGWGPSTLQLEGIEPVDINGGGRPVTGDPLQFVLVATGRADPATLGLDASVNVYAEDAVAG